MQLGMIGLGRMGANMVRRLMQAATSAWCSIAPQGGRRAGQGEGHRRVVAGGLRDKADDSRAHVADGAGGGRGQDASPTSLPLLETGDILIDGGNSYYVDDIRRAQGTRAEGNPLRRRRHQRRRLGTRTRLLHDDRRRGRSGEAPRSDLRHAGPGIGDIDRTPGREKVGGTAEQGYLHCGPNGAGHFVKMVHNGIEYGIMAAYAEGLDVLRGANIGKQSRRRSTPRRRRCAIPSITSTISISRDIAEVWRRGSVIASWLLDLTASRAGWRIRAGEVRRPRLRFGRRPLDDQGRASTRRANAGADARRCTSASARAAKPTSRTSCCRRCAIEFGGHIEKPAT